MQLGCELINQLAIEIHSNYDTVEKRKHRENAKGAGGNNDIMTPSGTVDATTVFYRLKDNLVNVRLL